MGKKWFDSGTKLLVDWDHNFHCSNGLSQEKYGLKEEDTWEDWIPIIKKFESRLGSYLYNDKKFEEDFHKEQGL